MGPGNLAPGRRMHTVAGMAASDELTETRVSLVRTADGRRIEKLGVRDAAG